MKRVFAFLAASLILSGAASAESRAYASITPKTAKSMAMGGVFSAVPTTEFSFFGNPAAFASQKAGLIVPTVDAWAYVKPTFGNVASLIKDSGDTSALMSTAFGLMAENGGTGGGVSAGIGFAGKGLGLGFFLTNDEYIEGASPASAIVHSETQAAGIVGLGVPLQLGSLRLSVGGDLRPFYRVRLHDSGSDAIVLADALSAGSGFMSSLYGDSFFGAAVDLGATLQLGSLTAGLSIRDIAPSFPIATTKAQDLEASLASGKLPSTSGATDAAVFVPNVSVGLSWAPKLVVGLIEPALYLELQDPVGVIKDWNGIGSALNLLHVGAEAKFLGFITLRGGLNRGWLSAGAGMKLLFLDLNAAVFTEELGALPGDNPRSGLSVQAAFRF